MATDSEVTLWIRWSLVLLLVTAIGFGQVKSYAPDIEVTCKSTVDLLALGYDAGVLVSRLPSRIPIYANEEERCDVYVSIPVGYELMLYFDWLDLYGGDLTRCESTSLQLFDGSPGSYLTGLQRRICGQEEEMPKDMYFVLKNFLILRVEANGNILGSGFRIHFTRYRITIPCSRDEFMCETYGAKRCIANHLVCDDWNDCGDWVDEEQYCDRLTPGAIAGIVLAAVFFVALFVFLIVWFCKRRDQVAGEEVDKDADFMMRSEPWKSSNIGTPAPFGVSSESMERQEYAPRYANRRSSGSRGKLSRSQELNVSEHEDAPPPYEEKGSRYGDESRSDDASEVFDDDRPRGRRNNNGRQPSTAPHPSDGVFLEEEEEEPPRMRRGRSRSQEDRLNSRPVEAQTRQTREDPRYAARQEDAPRRGGRESPRDDRYPPREDRPPSRGDRYPPRRDERDEEYDDRYPPRDDRRPSARDERDRRDDRDPRDRRGERDPRDRRDDRDPRDRRSERDPRDRGDDRDPRDRRSERDPRDRGDDRDPRDRRSERDPRDRGDDRDPTDRRSERDPRDRRSERDPRDRRSERDPRDRRSERDPRDRRSGPRDFSEDDDDDRSGWRDSLHPLREDRGLSPRKSLSEIGTDDERSHRGGGRSGDERSIPASEEFPPPPSHWDEPAPPQSRRKPDAAAAPPSGRPATAATAAPPAARDEEPPRGRQAQRPPTDIPPASRAPPPSAKSPTSPPESSELAADDPPPRSRRRRRSRSREGREGNRAGGRGEEPPAVVMLDYDDDDEPRAFKSRGLSYREEAV